MANTLHKIQQFPSAVLEARFMLQLSRQTLLRKSPIRRCKPQISFFSTVFNFPDTTTTREASSRQRRKRLDVAIVGAPNAGKSQLINVLTQSPVAAVSRKRHTTRHGILGARTIDDTQIVFKDTPGFLRLENAKEERLDRNLIVTAESEMQHVDFTLLVVDAARLLTDTYREALRSLMSNSLQAQGRIEEEEEEEIEEHLADRNVALLLKNSESNLVTSPPPLPPPVQPKFAIVLNKVDLVNPKSKLLDLAMDLGSVAETCLKQQYRPRNSENEELDFDTLIQVSPIVFYISALEEDGTDDLLQHLLDLATPCKSWAVPPGRATDQTPLERVQEIIREKIYRCLHREVPHSVTQINRMFRKVNGGLIIHQDLVVFTTSHQKLVLGSGGRTLQRIQESAQRDLQTVFGCNVILHLHVKLTKSKQRKENTELYSQGHMNETMS